MKRISLFLVIASVAIMALVFVGCSGKKESTTQSTPNQSISLASSIKPIGNGERWGDHDYSTFVPKPDSVIGDTLSLSDDDYFYVSVNFGTKASRDAYIEKAIAAGFREDADDGNEWRGTISISVGEYKSVYLTVEFSEMFGNGAIRIAPSTSPQY